MKVAYNGFTKYANALEKPPSGISNLKMGVKEACKELCYDFVDYSKNPDALIVELPLVGGFNYSHIDAAKTLQMLDKTKKVVITTDDLTFIRPFMKLKTKVNKIPFTMLEENDKFKKRWLKFIEDVYNKKYDYLQHTYEDEDVGLTCRNVLRFDYSFLSKYTNKYRVKEKRPISASSKNVLKLEDSSDIIVLSGLLEQDCFKKLCEHRVCYIRNYPPSVPVSCVRTRFVQSYYANALVVGLEKSPFKNDRTFCVSLDEYHQMTDEEFEKRVQLQQETFLKHTMSRQEAINVIKEATEIR